MMIKPASSACNLACTYCFYRDSAAKRAVPDRGFMTDAVTEAIIAKCLEEAEHCSFMFQGGEPTLAGLPFFRRFVLTVNRLNEVRRRTVSYAFQTNGLVLDRDWANFFRENRFLVGVSFDGTARLHDLHRKDGAGDGSARRVLRSISLLKEQGVEFNILSVVTPAMADNARPVWDFFKGRGLPFLQFIPAIDPFGEEPGAGSASLSPDAYARFLMQLFDLWYESLSSGKGVSVRFFDNLVSMLAGYPPESCDMAGVCSVQYVAESDGSIYPCDFYCTDEYLLGNILEASIVELDARRKKMQFVETSPNTDRECLECRWRPLCRGGCKRWRNGGVYRFCSAMKQFFPYAIERLERVAGSIRRQDLNGH